MSILKTLDEEISSSKRKMKSLDQEVKKMIRAREILSGSNQKVSKQRSKNEIKMALSQVENLIKARKIMTGKEITQITGLDKNEFYLAARELRKQKKIKPQKRICIPHSGGVTREYEWVGEPLEDMVH